jgi:hypothetical protein
VLILRGFKSLFSEALILVDLKPLLMSEIEKNEKFVEVLILEDLTEHCKLLILIALREKQGGRDARNSKLYAMYTQEYSTNLAWRQWELRWLRPEMERGRPLLVSTLPFRQDHCTSNLRLRN